MNVILKAAIGGVIGGGIGFLMYRFVGCRTGACPLTANPYVAIVIWGLMGVLMANGK